jgi:hypothetical protein
VSSLQRAGNDNSYFLGVTGYPGGMSIPCSKHLLDPLMIGTARRLNAGVLTKFPCDKGRARLRMMSIPNGSSSKAMDSAQPSSAHFDAQYIAFGVVP